MIRVAIVVALAGVSLVAATLPEQAATDSAQFDVVSVKENTSADQEGHFRSSPSRFTVTNIPLRAIILHAYQLLDHQVIGAPEWTDTPFDIIGTFPAGRAFTHEDGRLMLRKVLADRFGLKSHRETRELPAYALVLARKDGALGPLLEKSDVDCVQWLADKRPQMGGGGPRPAGLGGARPACMMMATRQMLSGGTQTIERLAITLQSMVGRPVMDRTGLTGTFNMEMRWTPSGDVALPPGANASRSDAGPSIFTAVQEQLGLKLEPTREPFDVLVIDAIQRPTPD